MNLGAALRAQNSEKWHMHVSKVNLVAVLRAQKNEKRHVHVEVNECEMDFTGITCVRESE